MAASGCRRASQNRCFGLTKVGNRVVVTPDEIEPDRVRPPASSSSRCLPKHPQQPASRSNEPTKVAINDSEPAGTLTKCRIPRRQSGTGRSRARPNAFRASRPPPLARRSRSRGGRQVDAACNPHCELPRPQKVAASEKAKQAVRDADADRVENGGGQSDFEPAARGQSNVPLTPTECGRWLCSPSFMGGATPPVRAKERQASSRADDREADLEDAILDASIEADAARDDLGGAANWNLQPIKSATAARSCARGSP